MSKFKNIPRRVDNILFHSGKEARRYQELKALEQAGIISGLELQKRFHLDVNGVHLADYLADFVYHDESRRQDVVEDVKSPATRTPVYLIKKRLMLALHEIEIEET